MWSLKSCSKPVIQHETISLEVEGNSGSVSLCAKTEVIDFQSDFSGLEANVENGGDLCVKAEIVVLIFIVDDVDNAASWNGVLPDFAA
jgi:hypothetical protein